MTYQRADPLEILVADGDPSFADAVTDASEAASEVVSARAVTSTEDVLESADTAGEPALDAVVVGDGLEQPLQVIEELAETTDLPVIFLTKQPADEETLEAAVAAGTTDVFPRTSADAVYEILIDQLIGDRQMDGNPDRTPGHVGSEPGELPPASRAVFENVSDGLVVLEPDTGEILDVNERFCEMNGYDRSALLGETIGAVTAPGDEYQYEAAEALIARARAEGPVLFEWRNQHREGRTFPVEVHMAVVQLGEDERILASVRDITERKQREREFEQIFNGVRDPITIHDPETADLLEVNDAFCEMMGYTSEELLDLGIDGFSPEGYTKERAREVVGEVVESGEPMELEWLVETSDGETRWLEVKGTVAEIGGEERFVAIDRDITEQRRTERILTEILDRIDEAVFLTRARDLTKASAAPDYLSAGYEEIWGQPLDDVVEAYEEGFFDTLHPDDVAGYREHVETLVEDVETGDPPDSTSLEYRIERPDGEFRWVRSDFYPIEWATGPARVVIVSRDVTERRRRETTIRELHHATERLHDAETADDVARVAVDAARNVLDLPMTACWLFDGDGGPVHDADDHEDPPDLEPVAATEPIREYGPASFESGDPEYRAVLEGETLLYDPSERFPENPLDAAVMLPLGDHGLLGAGATGVEAYADFIVDAGQSLASHVRLALDRVDRERQHRESERRFRTIAERVNEIIYLANADLTEVQYVNPAYEEIWGRPVDELYDDPRAFIEAIHPDDRDSYEAGLQEMLDDIEAGDPDDRYEFSYRIERPDGELRWVEATGYPVVDETEGPDRFVGVIQDVTERHRREQTLETFHEATRELTAAESREAACQEAVRAAESVLGFPLVSTHLYDDGTGALEPIAMTDRLRDLDVEPPAFGAGESLPWQVFVDGEAVSSSEPTVDIYGPGVSGPDVILPLGSHGVMLVGAPTDSFDAGDVELAQILAATLEAALNHVADERALAEREDELRQHQERADRLERLNAIIRDIEQATVEESSRAGIEEAVCDRLTDVDRYELVWVAEPTVRDDALVLRTSAGGKESYLDALSLDLDDGVGGHPATAAFQQGSPQTVRNVATDVAGGEWRSAALRHGIQSVVTVPISYENTTHGILTVASSEPDAFDEATRDILAELGRSIGYTITITEREKALESEGTTELEFGVTDDGLFMVRASAETGSRVELERTVRRAGGSFSTFYVVEGAAPGEVVELADAAPSVETAQVVSADEAGDGGLIEVSAPTWFGSVFTEHGAVVRGAEAEAGDGTLVVETPRGANVRALVEGFQERYPETELLAQRQRDRTIRSLFELQDALQEGLTDRQWEALETAYSAGYFEWPRDISGQEAADLLGVTQPTFNKHLRTAERRAFGMLLDREYPESGD